MSPTDLPPSSEGHIPAIPGVTELAEIGRGGMAVVYRGEETALARTVAVKVLAHHLSDPDGRRRFERELRIVGSLSDVANVLPTFDTGVTSDGRPYLVTPFMSGGTAQGRISIGDISVEETLEILGKIAVALASAHERGIVHGDIKPANILLSRDGEPFLSDFGVARLAADAATQTSTSAGTVAYLAPEVLAGERPGTPSDVYALAATAYALVTGLPPTMRSADDAHASVLNRIGSAPSPLPSSVPNTVAQALSASLSPDPEQRPTAQDLASVLASQRLSAVASGRRGRSSRRGWVSSRRNRTRKRGLLLLCGLLSLAIVGGGSYWVGSRNQHTVTTTPATPIIFEPGDLAMAPDGGVLFDDQFRVWHVNKGGQLSLFAGNGHPNFSGNGSLAVDAPMSPVAAIASDGHGNVFLAVPDDNVVLEVRPDHTVITFAGNGQPGYSGNGGPAIGASFHDPDGLLALPNGSLLIADGSDDVVRVVNAKGVVLPFAGDPKLTATDADTDGTPASQFYFSPWDMAQTATGNILVNDGLSGNIFSIHADNTVYDYAGTGVFGYSGDSGQATQAQLSGPTGLCTAPSGTAYVVDNGNNVVRAISPANVITTVLGDGRSGRTPTPGSALAAEMRSPDGIACGPDGTVYVSDSGNRRILALHGTNVTTFWQAPS